MTDTDNTGGLAQALYGDIVFRSKAASETLHPASSRGE
jgi:hypothetical protein